MSRNRENTRMGASLSGKPLTTTANNLDKLIKLIDLQEGPVVFEERWRRGVPMGTLRKQYGLTDNDVRHYAAYRDLEPRLRRAQPAATAPAPATTLPLGIAERLDDIDRKLGLLLDLARAGIEWEALKVDGPNPNGAILERLEAEA